MLANFIKRAKKWGDEVENWLSIFSCRDDAQLSFRPTTTDNDPINLGSKKNFWLGSSGCGQKPRESIQEFWTSKSFGVWPIHKRPSLRIFYWSNWTVPRWSAERPKKPPKREFLVKAEKKENFFGTNLKQWTQVIKPFCARTKSRTTDGEKLQFLRRT